MPDLNAVPCKIAVPGVTTSGGWTISAQILDKFDTATLPLDALGLRLTERFDADILGSELFLRTRRQGDMFRPLGMVGEKRIAGFMKDSHVPARLRDRLPVMVNSSGEVAWVVGWRIADWPKITDATRRIVEISCAYDRESSSRSRTVGKPGS